MRRKKNTFEFSENVAMFNRMRKKNEGEGYSPRPMAIACNSKADKCLKSLANSAMWSPNPGNGCSGNVAAFNVHILNACRNSGVEPSNRSWLGLM